MGGLSACAAGGGGVAAGACAATRWPAAIKIVKPSSMPAWIFIFLSAWFLVLPSEIEAVGHAPHNRGDDHAPRYQPPERDAPEICLNRPRRRAAARDHGDNEILPLIDVIERHRRQMQ